MQQVAICALLLLCCLLHISSERIVVGRAAAISISMQQAVCATYGGINLTGVFLFGRLPGFAASFRHIVGILNLC